MPKRKLYLHAGTGKTGSSALQLYFYNNVPALAEHGIRYPPGESDPDLRTGISSGNGLLYNNPDFAILNIEKTYAQLDDDGTGRDVLISSEAFSTLPAVGISELLAMCEDLDLELIPFLFIRDAEEWYRSVYQQLVKRHGYTRLFSAFIQDQPHRYPPALTVERFEAAVPEGKLQVFSYEDASSDIVTYTMRRVFGIAPPGIWTNQTINRSLTGREVFELVRQNRKGHPGYDASDAMIADRPVIRADERFSELIPRRLAAALRPDINYLRTKLIPPEMVYATTHERGLRPQQMTPARRAPRNTVR